MGRWGDLDREGGERGERHEREERPVIKTRQIRIIRDELRNPLHLARVSLVGDADADSDPDQVLGPGQVGDELGQEVGVWDDQFNIIGRAVSGRAMRRTTVTSLLLQTVRFSLASIKVSSRCRGNWIAQAPARTINRATT